MDLDRNALLIKARTTVNNYRRRGYVYFKYTCRHCGQRVCFSRPNVLYSHGDCYKCGGRTEVKAGGYVLILAREGLPCPTQPVIDKDGASPTCHMPSEGVDLRTAIETLFSTKEMKERMDEFTDALFKEFQAEVTDPKDIDFLKNADNMVTKGVMLPSGTELPGPPAGWHWRLKITDNKYVFVVEKEE